MGRAGTGTHLSPTPARLTAAWNVEYEELMSNETPRLAPLPESEWDDEAREQMGRAAGASERHVPNVFTTLLHHPKLLKRWLVFGAHLLGKSSLAPRERELVILRTSWCCRAEYEWSHHTAIGKASGLTEEEIARVVEGPEADGWSALDRALLRATDELCADRVVSDAAWDALAGHLDKRQLLDFLFTVGQYTMLAMVLRTLRVALDPGTEGFPDQGS